MMSYETQPRIQHLQGGHEVQPLKKKIQNKIEENKKREKTGEKQN